MVSSGSLLLHISVEINLWKLPYSLYLDFAKVRCHNFERIREVTTETIFQDTVKNMARSSLKDLDNIFVSFTHKIFELSTWKDH